MLLYLDLSIRRWYLAFQTTRVASFWSFTDRSVILNIDATLFSSILYTCSLHPFLFLDFETSSTLLNFVHISFKKTAMSMHITMPSSKCASLYITWSQGYMPSSIRNILYTNIMTKMWNNDICKLANSHILMLIGDGMHTVILHPKN